MVAFSSVSYARERIALGPFLLHNVVGRGGMGEVWSATHAATGERVAIKVITDSSAMDSAVRRAFDSEVRSIARLDHGAIARVHDYGTIDQRAAEASGGLLQAGSPYLAMEFLAGGALDTMRAPADWSALRALLLRLLEGLAHAHSRGLVHRDLSPGNILFSSKEREPESLRITDFGIAHALVQDEGDEDQESHSGTVLYMSPEQLHGRWRDHGPWTDLYAVGCIAWELATGRRPTDADSVFSIVFSRLHGELAPFEPRLDLPERFEDWVRRLLERDPRDRFRNSADAAFALAELESDPVFGPPQIAESWQRPPSAEPTAPPFLDVGVGLLGMRSPPPLGRDRALAQLWTTLRDVWQGARPRLTIVEGPVGSGRSSLARFFCQRASELGAANWVRAAHDSRETARTGLQNMLDLNLGTQGLTAEEREERVRQQLADQDVKSRWEVSSLLAFLDSSWTGTGIGGLPAIRFSSSRERFSVLRRYLRRRATERPLILVLDDLHWGADSVDFVEHLLLESPANVGPLLILATYTLESPGTNPRLLERIGALPATARVRLGPLEPAEAERLGSEQLRLSPRLARDMARRAGGNPSFILEAAEELRRRARLRKGPAGLELVDPHRPPGGLDSRAEIRRTRLAAVASMFGDDAIQSLEVASALGRRVSVFEWSHACRNVRLRANPELVDALLSAGLVHVHETGWSFRSEGLRAELEQGARRSGQWPVWNEAVALMIQQRFSHGGLGVARRRARHLLEADASKLGEAISELGEAAWQDVEHNRFGSALELVELREDALNRLGAGPSDPRWGECMLVRSGALVHLDDHVAGLEVARQAEVAASRYGWRMVLPRALGQQAVIALQAGDEAEAHARWDEAIRLCSSRDVQSRGRLLWYLAEFHRRAGKLESAGKLHDAAFDHFGRCGDAGGRAEARLGLALTAQEGGKSQRAERYLVESQALFTEAGARGGLATVAALRGALAQFSGDLVGAASAFRESAETRSAIGSVEAVPTWLELAAVEAQLQNSSGLSETL